MYIQHFHIKLLNVHKYLICPYFAVETHMLLVSSSLYIFGLSAELKIILLTTAKQTIFQGIKVPFRPSSYDIAIIKL